MTTPVRKQDPARKSDAVRVSRKSEAAEKKKKKAKVSAERQDDAPAEGSPTSSGEDRFTPWQTLTGRCRRVIADPGARAGALSSAAALVAGTTGFMSAPSEPVRGPEIHHTVTQVINDPCLSQVDSGKVAGERLLDNCQMVLHFLDANPRLASIPEYGKFRQELQEHYDAANRHYGARAQKGDAYLEDIGRFADRVRQWVNTPEVQIAAKETHGIRNMLGELNLLLILLTSLVGVVTGRQVNRAAEVTG